MNLEVERSIHSLHRVVDKHKHVSEVNTEESTIYCSLDISNCIIFHFINLVPVQTLQKWPQQ